MSFERAHLEDLNRQLQDLIDVISDMAQHQEWSDLADIDQRVNRLVHCCVEAGQINEPSIHRKVMSMARIYRQVIDLLSQERSAIHQQWQNTKQSKKMQAGYKAAGSACA